MGDIRELHRIIPSLRGRTDRFNVLSAARICGAMGMLISVIEKPSAKHGIVRFETNRALTGMAHERYETIDDTFGTRPPDLVARGILETGNADSVHVHGNIITVELRQGGTSAGMAELITDLFTYYRPGVLPSLP